MSFGGGSSQSAPPLKTLSVSDAAQQFQTEQNLAYSTADTAYAAGFTGPLAAAAPAMVSELGTEVGGGIGAQATGALNTAGLGDQAKAENAGNAFQSARNLGQPILSKENRGRNYATNVLSTPYFQPRSKTLSMQDVLDIVTGNTGNVNAYRQAVAQTQANSAISNTLQGSQNFAALASLLGTGAKTISNPYTDPFSSLYTPTFSPYTGALIDPSLSSAGQGGA